MILTKNNQDHIQQQIEEIERKTTGEIVPVVVLRSSPHAFFHAWLLPISFLFGLSFLWLWDYFSDFSISLHIGIMFLMIVTVGSSFLFLPSLQRTLIGEKARKSFVHERALLEFTKEGLMNTRGRTGILILVSLFEKRIQVLADTGFNGKVTPEEWQKVSDHAAKHLSHQKIFEALSEATEQVGLILKNHFSLDPSDQSSHPDELSDKVRIKK